MYKKWLPIFVLGRESSTDLILVSYFNTLKQIYIMDLTPLYNGTLI